MLSGNSECTKPPGYLITVLIKFHVKVNKSSTLFEVITHFQVFCRRMVMIVVVRECHLIIVR